MFCPKCGKSDQAPETYCRQCGVFLPDLTKTAKAPIPPQQHVTANLVLSGMTIVVCFTLAFLLYLILAFRPDTHPLIYATASLLIAMGAWHVQTFWRTILLRRHFKKAGHAREAEPIGPSIITGKLLDTFNVETIVPPSVTERTTRHLVEVRSPSAKSQQ